MTASPPPPASSYQLRLLMLYHAFNVHQYLTLHRALPLPIKMRFILLPFRPYVYWAFVQL